VSPEIASSPDDRLIDHNFITLSEVNDMDESSWVKLKLEMQDFLCRTENLDNPAFTDDEVAAWIATNSETFNKFYQAMRAEKPEQLIGWWKNVMDEDNLNDGDFIGEWSKFKVEYGPRLIN